MGKVATIKDVANFAGVSIATVSRVINNAGTVNPEMQERVLSAIQELKYSPNNVARNLKKSHTSSVAFIMSNISDPFFISIARSVEDYLQEYGYSLMVYSIDHSAEKEANCLALLQENKVDGAIINTSGFNDELISEFSQHTPVVLSNRKIFSNSFVGDFVDDDNIGCAYELTRQLIHSGHKKIAIVNGPRHLSTAKERFIGFSAALREAGIFIDSSYPYQYSGNFTEQSGYDGVKTLLNMSDPPTAIVLASSSLALGAMNYFVDYNIAIPEDVSFVCIGEMINHKLLFIQPTFSAANQYSMGQKIASFLVERIQSKKPLPNREFRLSSTFITGNSIKSI